jgi:hypothetical protein
MLVFDPVSHSYKNKFTGEFYTSVTRMIHSFKKPFDSDTMASRVAQREGVSKEDILARWKKDNDKSKDYGTELHAVIEKYLKTGTFNPEYTNFIQAFIDLDIVSKKDDLLVEHQVYSHEYALAGTSDLIRLESKGGFSVFDLKTNKKFNLVNQYNEYLLHPLDHLSASEYNIYSLQLSTYAYMYQCITGRRVNNIGVFYYDRNTEKFQYYPMTYKKYDVKTMLDYFKTHELHRQNHSK